MGLLIREVIDFPDETMRDWPKTSPFQRRRRRRSEERRLDESKTTFRREEYFGRHLRLALGPIQLTLGITRVWAWTHFKFGLRPNSSLALGPI